MGITKNAHAYTWAFMFWSRQQDLNLRPTHYECAALQLSYTGIDMKYCNKWSGGLSNEFCYFREGCVFSRDHAERMHL